MVANVWRRAARVYPKLVSFTTHDPRRAVEHAEAAMGILSPERDPGPLAQIVFDRFWAELGLSTIAFVDFVDGDHRAVDASLTRMRERMETIAMKELAPDRSEPFHV